MTMKSINVNELQNQISKIMREVEGGEIFEVSRYSKPVAYLMPRDKFEEVVSGSQCRKCMQDLRKIARKIKG